MDTRRRVSIVAVVLMVAVGIPLLLGNQCVPGPIGPDTDNLDLPKVSEGRINALRALVAGHTVFVDLRQRDPAVAAQNQCDPLGTQVGHAPWNTRVAPAGPITLGGGIGGTPPSEYDLISTTAGGETDYIISIRVIDGGVGLITPMFTSVEFNFRAVNPFEQNHVLAGPDYEIGEARFPSNEDQTPLSVPPRLMDRRSLIDLNVANADVAIIVRGLEFNPLLGAINNTSAHMNGLGPLAWLLFMRDNALQSGRFFNLRGAWTGGPRAFEFDPAAVPPGVPGMFQSAQINGDVFDTLSEPPANMAGAPNFLVCDGVNPPQPYALLDYSNLDQAGVAAPSQGGFIFVMRDDAWRDPADDGGGAPDDTSVVVDPSANPFNPPAVANLMAAPNSGYDEPNVPGINGPAAPAIPDETDNGAVGEPGVHEMSVAVFFIHT